MSLRWPPAPIASRRASSLFGGFYHMIFITITRSPYQTAASNVKGCHGLRGSGLGTTMRRRAQARRAQGGGPARIMATVRHRVSCGRIGAGVLLAVAALPQAPV